MMIKRPIDKDISMIKASSLSINLKFFARIGDSRIEPSTGNFFLNERTTKHIPEIIPEIAAYSIIFFAPQV